MAKRKTSLPTSAAKAPQPEVLPPGNSIEAKIPTPIKDSDEQDVPASPLEVEVLPPGSVDEILPAEDYGSINEAESSADVIPYDPLHAYLREIRRYRMLSPEQERDLALRYRKFKDLDAAYKLVASNLWLVVKIARDYERAVRSLLDLIQEGNIGLMEAVKNFDPYRGVRFPSYATWWIKAYIIRYVIANWRLVKIGTTQAQRKLFFNLKKEKEKLEREGFRPTPKLLAEKLQVKESEIVEMEQRLGAPEVSMDAPLQDNSESTLLSVLSDSGLSAEELLARKQMKELLLSGLEEFSTTLKAKELVVFKERLLGEDKVTLQDIAEKLSISRERVRQIENRVREKLKAFLLERLGPAIDNFDFD